MDNTPEKINRLRQEGTQHPHPEKVQAEQVGTSSFFDANDLVQMKYEMLRSVSADEQSVADASRAFGLSRVAYYRAYRQYQADGLAGLLPRQRGPKGPHKLSDEVMDWLDETLGATLDPPDWSELSREIETRFDVRVHPRSIQRAWKHKKGAEK